MKKIIGNELFVTKLIEYQAATNKGETAQGSLINNPFKLAKADSNYTGATVIETVAEAGKVKWGDANSIGVVGKLSGETEPTWHQGYVMKADGSLVLLSAVQVGDEVTYVYNNMVVPQNDLPRIKAEMKNIPLIAKARRIAINKYVA